MGEQEDRRSHVSKIIRERALAILRDTRSKIDPTLLAAMKEKITPTFKMPPKKETPPPVPETPLSEPVDKQKIAAIVLEYMKHRKDSMTRQ